MNLIFFLAGMLLALGLASSQRAYVESLRPEQNLPSKKSWIPAAAGRYLLTAGFFIFAIQVGHAMLLCAFAGLFFGRWFFLIRSTNPRDRRRGTPSHSKGLER